MDQVRDVGQAIVTWRTSLPRELRMGGVREWDSSNVWILVIHAFSYRLECLFYRTLRKRASTLSETDATWINHQSHDALFELSTLIRRAMAHEVLQVGPPSM